MKTPPDFNVLDIILMVRCFPGFYWVVKGSKDPLWDFIRLALKKRYRIPVAVAGRSCGLRRRRTNSSVSSCKDASMRRLPLGLGALLPAPYSYGFSDMEVFDNYSP